MLTVSRLVLLCSVWQACCPASYLCPSSSNCSGACSMLACSQWFHDSLLCFLLVICLHARLGLLGVCRVLWLTIDVRLPGLSHMISPHASSCNVDSCLHSLCRHLGIRAVRSSQRLSTAMMSSHALTGIFNCIYMSCWQPRGASQDLHTQVI